MRTLRILLALASVVLGVLVAAAGPAAAAEAPADRSVYCFFTDGVYYGDREILAPIEVCVPGP
jgi:hypothetical protein